MSTWNYRLVVDDTDVAAIREVLYNGIGRVIAYTETLDTWPLEDLDLVLVALCSPPLMLRDLG